MVGMVLGGDHDIGVRATVEDVFEDFRFVLIASGAPQQRGGALQSSVQQQQRCGTIPWPSD